jgi:V8-like Glu-specific endopeptidase
VNSIYFYLALSVSFTFFSASFSFGDHKVIYGEDQRRQFSEVSSEWQHLAKSVAVMIHKNSFISDGLFYSLRDSNESRKLCPGERFRGELSAASCTGFLVAPNVIATAGHCVPLFQNNCRDFQWVFNYTDQNFHQNQSWKIAKENVYSCRKVIRRRSGWWAFTDYALIQLDRPVGGEITPLTYRKWHDQKIDDKAELVLIGAPTGLPLKIADGAFIRDNSHRLHFTASLDSFQGNSGSPVFNKETKQVEGILVNGERDYIEEELTGCLKAKRCGMDECLGEQVTRITAVRGLN